MLTRPPARVVPQNDAVGVGKGGYALLFFTSSQIYTLLTLKLMDLGENLLKILKYGILGVTAVYGHFNS